VGAPTLAPYCKVLKTETHAVFERNPYFFSIDIRGNQLPYIDTILTIVAADREARSMKVIAGEIDYASMTTADFPLLKMNMKDGGYRIIPARMALGSVLNLGFNCNHRDPALRAIFSDLRFRRAMSLAIDRDEINDIVFFGKGVPAAATVHPSCSYYRPQWGTEHPFARFDPAASRLLLDSMGLGARDAAGLRLRPDGKQLGLHILYPSNSMTASDILELVAEYWNAVGVKTTVKAIEASYYRTMIAAAEHEVSAWELDATLEGLVHTWPAHKFEFGSDCMAVGMQWASWCKSGGASGEQPPPEVQRFYRWLDAWSTCSQGSARYVSLADSIFSWYADQLWEIATVGRPVMPIVVSRRLANVDNMTNELYGFDTQTSLPYLSIQWFFIPPGATPGR
jgi:peptide/nickel transport system substrate-binding protein